MNKKLTLWTMALALLCAPAFAAAQEGPGPEDEEEVEMMEDGPGESGMRPGMGGRGQMGPGMQQRGQGQDMDQERMLVKKRMMMRQGKEGGSFPEEKVLGVIKKHDPAFAKKVEDLKETAPAKYKMVLQMSGKLFAMARMQQDETIEKDAVRALALEFESKELSLRYNKASDSDKKSIRERLKVVLGELFDLKSKGQEMRARHMEEEIGRLKKNLEKRKASKAKIVEQRLEQLTGEGYGW
ncbi:MAG TPA: hypothetical protein DCW72_02430 [Elusimicrobia bacterium]|nr:MAG: hypothetical protein A2X29_00510 [Elusimicrobia bacterium GWA2_64_40]OGR66123.1 MAG: hypothetical protein A2X30_09810 [Elusimicrobia bacterium GWB2_63_16]HAN03682.1 hypothetical protein [Elusimicrobiota bacterium]HAU89111.1 hypothetical protein [Elusimicrobiota bacterium]